MTESCMTPPRHVSEFGWNADVALALWMPPTWSPQGQPVGERGGGKLLPYGKPTQGCPYAVLAWVTLASMRFWRGSPWLAGDDGDLVAVVVELADQLDRDDVLQPRERVPHHPHATAR